MREKNYFCVIVSSILLSGCLPSVDPRIDMKPPVYVDQLPSKRSNQHVNSGSLYGRGDNPLFYDRKAMNVNDIVTVVINERANQSSSGNHSTKKNSTTALGGGVFSAGAAPLSSVANELNKYGNIGFKAGSENEFSGTGSSTRTESFNTTMSARIIKVLENGNYFIEGSREILVNGEKQIVQLSGVIRPYDISNSNEINSKHIADAKILYKTEGDVDRATKKPWGTRIMDAIWPF